MQAHSTSNIIFIVVKSTADETMQCAKLVSSLKAGRMWIFRKVLVVQTLEEVNALTDCHRQDAKKLDLAIRVIYHRGAPQLVL